MRILYMGLNVRDLNESLNMYTELVLEFRKNGHKIDIVAPAEDTDRRGLRNEAGINVLRVPTLKLFKVGFLIKGLANVMLPFQYKRALRKSSLELDYDLVMMPTPPITLSLLAAWFKRRYNSKIYVILRDIFPQNAVDLEIMSKRNPIYYYFRWQEKLLYKTADFVGCMSQGNIDFVLQHNNSIDPEKFHLLPNWRNIKPLLGDDELSQVRNKYGLSGKFVAFFGGNIGKPQKVENLVALMEACQDVEGLQFVIVGDGNEKNRLDLLIQQKGLRNVLLLGWISGLEFHRLMQAADVGLISLSENFTIPNIPSKTLSYFNAKKPILASTDINTDYNKILEESGSGLWSEAGKTENWKTNLLTLMNDRKKAEEMGVNGFNYMKENLLTSKAFKKILCMVNPVVEKVNQINSN